MDVSIYTATPSAELVPIQVRYNYPDLRPSRHTLNVDAPVFTSLRNLMMGKCTLNDVMDEFRKNGIDSPYDPDEDIWRQKPIETIPETEPVKSGLTEEQLRVLRSLPDHFISELLKYLNPGGGHAFKRGYSFMECRFCKNNGERDIYCRSHNLKDVNGRVLCPVLRAFVCRRCGASGDNAHTIKYCPHSTEEERMQSTAMLRTVRMASGRRRVHSGPREHTFAYNYGNVPISQPTDVFNAYQTSPLDPLWAAVEQKLLL